MRRMRQSRTLFARPRPTHFRRTVVRDAAWMRSCIKRPDQPLQAGHPDIKRAFGLNAFWRKCSRNSDICQLHACCFHNK